MQSTSDTKFSPREKKTFPRLDVKCDKLLFSIGVDVLFKQITSSLPLCISIDLAKYIVVLRMNVRWEF